MDSPGPLHCCGCVGRTTFNFSAVDFIVCAHYLPHDTFMTFSTSKLILYHRHGERKIVFYVRRVNLLTADAIIILNHVLELWRSDDDRKSQNEMNTQSVLDSINEYARRNYLATKNVASLSLTFIII